MICTAPLMFAAGGNRPRVCGKPATHVLGDGKGRCNKHNRGRGTKIEKAPPEKAPLTKGLVNGEMRLFRAVQPLPDETTRDAGYDGDGE